MDRRASLHVKAHTKGSSSGGGEDGSGGGSTGSGGGSTGSGGGSTGSGGGGDVVVKDPVPGLLDPASLVATTATWYVVPGLRPEYDTLVPLVD
jgi:hypothetical protein